MNQLNPITPKINLFFFSSLLLLTSCTSTKTSNSEKEPKPNVIIILADDLGYGDISCYAQKNKITPNIDLLAEHGVRCTDFYVPTPYCAPSRATLLTGMFPQTNGVSTNQEGREFNPDKTPSFAQILQQEGYKTAFIGKWHMAESFEPRKGFDYWCSFSGQGNYNGNDLNINGKVIRNEGYITDELNKYALDFVSKNAENPFCLYLSHKAVHQPFTPAERDKDLYDNDLVPEPAGWSDNMQNKPAWQRIEPNMNQRLRLRDKELDKITPVKSRQFGPWPAKTGKGEQKNYLRCLSAVDDGIGEIYDLLQKTGKLDNTVIVFAGDNGFFHGEHGKDDKRLAYNESMRIPLVMRYPKMAKAGNTVSEMVLNADIAPTFLDVAGVQIPAQMQGKSVIPLLQGKNEGWRKSFLFTYWPDLIYFIPRIAAIRTERYLYSTTPDLKEIDELYDEQADPAELNNLAENPDYSELKSKLSKELEQLKKETGYRDEVPRPDPEPVPSVKTGKIFSLDFKDITFNDPSNKEIIMKGVKRITDNGKICGSFLDGGSVVIANNPDRDPSVGTFIIDCVIKPASPDGVIASSGSQKDGWALFIEEGIPGFVVSHGSHLQFVDGTTKITGKWSHLVAVIENYKNIISLYADGKLLGQRKMLLPIHSISIKAGDIILGQDAGDRIDPKVISNYKFVGLIKHFSIYRGKKTAAEFIKQSFPTTE